jgi:hypothetical protein
MNAPGTPVNRLAHRLLNRARMLYAPGSPLRYVRKTAVYTAKLPTLIKRRRVASSAARQSGLYPTVSQLASDGFAFVSDRIESPLYQELDSAVRRKMAVDGDGRPVSANPNFRYFGQLLTPDDLTGADIFLRFALQEQWLRIAAAYLGQAPKLSSIELLVSKPTDADRWHESQLWHRDYTDSKLLKLFVYLSDVDDESGPFTFIPAGPSATVKREHLLPRRISDERMTEQVSAADIVSVRGPSGTAFVVDTAMCYHLGSRCRSRKRIAYVAMYNTIAELTRHDLAANAGGVALSALQQMALYRG